MNREIKFRAWDNKEKEMLKEYTPDMFFSNNQDMYHNSTNMEWMQYTGLKDKNEKDIYEGDIVKGQTFHESVEVKWDVLGYYPFNSRFPELNVETIPNCCEIIGNIYENPDLIKLI